MNKENMEKTRKLLTVVCVRHDMHVYALRVCQIRSNHNADKHQSSEQRFLHFVLRKQKILQLKP